MARLLNLLLMLLVIVAFFFGLRLGKWVQLVDTPVKEKVKVQKEVVIPTVNIIRYVVQPCKFEFTAPDTIHVAISSTSASLSQKADVLDITCSKTKQMIIATGSSTLLDQVKQGFDTTFSIQSSKN
ncbi:MAG: hypothetical protein WC775_05245 [Patescibacteria group bacterium]|jgi:hypothetical protein